MQMRCEQCPDLTWRENQQHRLFLANHLHDPEMKQFNIPATNSIQ